MATAPAAKTALRTKVDSVTYVFDSLELVDCPKCGIVRCVDPDDDDDECTCEWGNVREDRLKAGYPCPGCPADPDAPMTFEALQHLLDDHICVGVAECTPCPWCLRIAVEPGPYPELHFCGHCRAPVCPSCDELAPEGAPACARCGVRFCGGAGADCAALGLTACSGEGAHLRCAECASDENVTSPPGICPDCDPVAGAKAADRTEHRSANRGRTSV